MVKWLRSPAFLSAGRAASSSYHALTCGSAFTTAAYSVAMK